MCPVGIVDASAGGAFDLAANRAGRTTKAFGNGSNGAQVVAHGHDDGALLGSQMFVISRHGGTLQQRCCTWFLRTPFFFALALAPCPPRRAMRHLRPQSCSSTQGGPEHVGQVFYLRRPFFLCSLPRTGMDVGELFVQARSAKDQLCMRVIGQRAAQHPGATSPVGPGRCSAMCSSGRAPRTGFLSPFLAFS